MPVVTGIQLKMRKSIVSKSCGTLLKIEWILVFHIARFHTIIMSGISMDSAKIHDIKFDKSAVYGKYFDTVHLRTLLFSTIELKARKRTGYFSTQAIQTDFRCFE